MPRWQQSHAIWTHGQLLVREQHDRALGRSLIVARMVDGQQADLLPELLDARLLLVDRERTVLTGMERDVLTRSDMAQTWLLLRGDGEPPEGAGIIHPE